MRLPAVLDPDTLGSLLRSQRFSEASFDEDPMEQHPKTLRGGFVAYYPRSTGNPPRRIAVAYFVKGEGARPTAAQRAKKVEAITRIAALLGQAYAVRVNPAGTSLVVTVPAAKAPRAAAKRGSPVGPFAPRVTHDEEEHLITLEWEAGGHRSKAVYQPGDMNVDTQFFVDNTLVETAVAPQKIGSGTFAFGDRLSAAGAWKGEPNYAARQAMERYLPMVAERLVKILDAKPEPAFVAELRTGDRVQYVGANGLVDDALLAEHYPTSSMAKEIGGFMVRENFMRGTRVFSRDVSGRKANGAQRGDPPRKFKLGDRVSVTGTKIRGRVSFVGEFDRELGQRRYVVTDDDGTGRKNWNENTLKKIGSSRGTKANAAKRASAKPLVKLLSHRATRSTSGGVVYRGREYVIGIRDAKAPLGYATVTLQGDAMGNVEIPASIRSPAVRTAIIALGRR